MSIFSERYGYVAPRDALIREQITREIQNAICSAFDLLAKELNEVDDDVDRYCKSYSNLELAIWTLFENQRSSHFYIFGGHKVVATEYLESNVEWYKKLDMVEFALDRMDKAFTDVSRRRVLRKFVQYLNDRFKILGFAYRIIDNIVVEITSESEIVEIEQSLNAEESISEHISSALSHLSNKTSPDYRNSIKESISAVEFICRKITGRSTLGESLKELDNRGVVIPQMLITAFEKMYVYTNDKTTGIRHALMDSSNSPTFDEAKFMLVACSAFVNYINSKYCSLNSK